MKPVNIMPFIMRGKIKAYALKSGEKRYWLSLYYKGRLRVYSDQQGYPLDSLPKAERVLSHINYLIDHNIFDPSQWKRKDQKQYIFSNVIQEWGNDKDYAPSYLSNVRKYIALFNEFFGKTDIRIIRTKGIKDFAKTLKEYSPKTRKNILGLLRSFLRDCYQDEIITRVPLFPKIIVQDPEVKWATEEEQVEIINEIADEMDRAFLWFQITYGTRTGETRALKRDCVDYKKNQIIIRRAFSESTLMEYTKTRNIRYLPLYDDIKRMAMDLPPCIDGFVFHRHGQPYPRNRMQRIWKRIAKKKGIEAHLYGGTRHSFATHALMRGNSIELVGAFMGHTSGSTTRRYAHIVWEDLKKVGRD